MCAGKARRTRAKPRHRNPSARHASVVKLIYPRVKRVKTFAARRSFAVARGASCNLTAVSLPGSLLGSLPVSLCSTPR